MSAAYASAQWHVKPGSAAEFVAAWEEFLSWTRSTQQGLEQARLLRDDQDPDHFVSYAEWADADARQGWQGDPQFAEHLRRLIGLCRDAHTSTYSESLRIR